MSCEGMAMGILDFEQARTKALKKGLKEMFSSQVQTSKLTRRTRVVK